MSDSNMEPIIAARQPSSVELEAGKTYYFCRCGRSKKQPFCDGSHQGADFTPHVFEVDESKNYYLCMCKHTANTPFCDGSHSKL